MRGMMNSHHLAGMFSKLGEKVGRRLSALCQRKQQDSHDNPKLATRDQHKSNRDGIDEAARIVVVHSRLPWSPEHTVGSSQGGNEAQSTLGSSFQQFLSQNKIYNAFPSGNSSSQSALRTRSQSPSPSEGHSRGLERQNQNYAHDAWTPPDEVFDVGFEEECRRSESFVKDFTERCKERACHGAFDEEVIKYHFDRSYRLRTTPEEQELASTEFRKRVQAKADKRRLEFERLHKQEGVAAGTPRSRVAPTSGQYQVDFLPGVYSGMSNLGDIVGEVMGRSGGSGFI